MMKCQKNGRMILFIDKSFDKDLIISNVIKNNSSSNPYDKLQI